MKNEFYLCVDVGQTRLKIAIYDKKLRLKNQVSTTLKTIEKNEGFAERDLENLWVIFLKQLKKIISNSRMISGNIKYLCISGHGDGYFPIDKDGNPTRNAIISLDSRARKISDSINNKLGGKILKLTGQLTNPNNPAMIMKWIKKNEPKNLEKTRWILFCKDWLKFKLTGTISTDYSSASAGLTNVHTGEYDIKIFKLLKISYYKNKFPLINKPNKIIGCLKAKIKIQIGIKQNIEVLEGLHDVSSAMLGAGCASPNKLLLIGGTFSVAQMISTRPLLNENLLCRTSYEINKWINIAFTPSGSNCIDWILKLTNQKIEDLDDILEEVGSKRKNNIIFIPYLYGAQTGRNGFGEFRNLEGYHDKKDLIISVVEGVIFNIVNQINFLNKKISIKKIFATGGLFKTFKIIQITTNLLKKKIYIDNKIESGIVGSAILCRSADQNYINLKILRNKNIQIFNPNKENYSYLQKKYLNFCKIKKAIDNK